MSIENKKTVNVYQNGGAEKYLLNSKVHDELDTIKAEKKKKNLNDFVLKNLSTLKNGASVFEVGSANGQTAKFIQENGYEVVASDVADAFICEIDKQGVKTVKFNILKDEFSSKFDCFYVWRVFVHFTMEDLILSLKKMFNALNDDGILIFNVMNRETHDVDGEMVDFAGEYYMGEERYYHYFRKEDIDKIVSKIGFKIKSFHKEGGDEKNKWLVYVLSK